MQRCRVALSADSSGDDGAGQVVVMGGEDRASVANEEQSFRALFYPAAGAGTTVQTDLFASGDITSRPREEVVQRAIER